jgi:hypothetical protein
MLIDAKFFDESYFYLIYSIIANSKIENEGYRYDNKK